MITQPRDPSITPPGQTKDGEAGAAHDAHTSGDWVVTHHARSEVALIVVGAVAVIAMALMVTLAIAIVLGRH